MEPVLIDSAAVNMLIILAHRTTMTAIAGPCQWRLRPIPLPLESPRMAEALFIP